ncbi:MAG: PorT family protein [Bacteroidetes bacterium]|nr:PorT family protein [Bacteroidota bacterium]MCB0842029.1 PorT family protein [Bacteroidota bacterium]MCB0854209.1 PorT family protein [Bacteroidota bacterium]
MKKNGLLFLFLILCFSFLSAQNLGGGLSIGLNASQVDGDEFRGFNKAGLSFGGFVNYQFTDILSLQPEILFEQLGSANQQMLLVHTNHISFPVLAAANIPIDLGESVHEVQLVAGPVIGLLLKAKDFNVDITDRLKRVDARITGGVAYRMGSISLSLRYGYSLNTFAKGTNNIGLFLSGPFHHYVNFSLRLHLMK